MILFILLFTQLIRLVIVIIDCFFNVQQHREGNVMKVTDNKEVKETICKTQPGAGSGGFIASDIKGL